MSSYVISGNHTSGIILNDPTTQNAATVATGAYVSNPGAAGDREAVYGTNAAAWTLSNYGTISAAGASVEGIALAAGGDITNATSGFIYGYDRGIAIYGTAGTVVNGGTIANGNTATYDAIHLFAGGYVGNTTTTALIAGQAGGVYIGGGAGTVSNLGTISAGGSTGIAIDLAAGGTMANNAGGLIIGGDYGIFASAAATVINAGTIASTAATTGNGVTLTAGGVIVNGGVGATAARIAGDYGARINGGTGTIVNYGTIAGSFGGAALSDGGLFVNGPSGATSALVSGFFAAGFAGPTPTVINYATIAGGGGGAALLSPGNFTNEAGGLVYGAGFGFAVWALATPGMVTNDGTIAGSYHSTAIQFTDGGTVVNQALIASAYRAVNIYGGAGSLVNFGTVTAADLSVALGAGGAVTNGATGVTSALITGGSGVEIYGAVGSVANYGTIVGTTPGLGNRGVVLGNGGILTNYGLIEGVGVLGVLTEGAPATVVNSGTILSSLGGGYVYFAAFLAAGGYLSNRSGGLISGYPGAVALSGAAATFVNLGTVAAAGSGSPGGYLAAGGFVGNGAATVASARIVGYGAGVKIAGGSGSVVNYGTIAGTGAGADGIDLFAGGVVVNSGLLTGSGDVVEIDQGGSLSNLGTILGAAASYGVCLREGGTLTNGATASPGAMISVYGNAVEVQTNPGAVANYGTLESTGINGAGVVLAAGGTLTNRGAIVASGTGYPTAVYLASGGLVDNFGTASASSSAEGSAIQLAQGGTVVNRVGGLLQASGDALVINGTSVGADSVANYGTIAGDFDGIVLKSLNDLLVNAGVISGTAVAGVYLYGGGSATNTSTGLIQGYYGVISTHDAATVVNAGTIVGTGGIGIGVDLTVSGSTLVNAGTVVGSGGIAAYFAGAGNRLIIDPGAVFSGIVNGGAGNNTLELAAGASSGSLNGLDTGFVGFDTLTVDSGAAWQLGAFSDPGTLINSGSINGTATLAAGGYLDNQSSGTIAGASQAVYGTGGPGTIVNAGTIGDAGASEAIYLRAGGAVTNAATGALIAAYVVGIDSNNSPVTIANLGTISASFSHSDALYLQAGASVTNGASGTGEGLIETTGYNAVRIDGGAGAVTNFGTIISTGTLGIGVILTAGGTIINSGLLAGGDFGAYLEGGTTLTNAGTVAGSSGNAVSFRGSYNRLIVDPGAAFAGAVYGGIAGTLELAAGAGAGTLSGLGANFSGFGTLVFDSGAAWQVSGAATAVSAVAITGFQAFDTLDLGGIVANGDTYAGGVLTLTNNGAVAATLAVSTPIANPVFTLGTDGSGGTLVKASSASTGMIFSGTYTSGIVLSNPTTQNPATVANGGYVTNSTAAYSGDAVFGTGAAGWTLANYGTIDGTLTGADGILLVAGGQLINGPSATIAGDNTGAWLEGGGTAVNYGLIAGTGTGGDGVVIGTTTSGVGTIVNHGTIEGANLGVWLAAGGDARNYGVIAGGFGIAANTGAGTVSNYGTILGGAFNGVYLAAGGSVTNHGFITATGTNSAVFINQLSGVVDNDGTIIGGIGSDGVHLVSGAVANGLGGLVAGPQGVGVLQQNGTGPVGAGTVVNSGTIVGTSLQGVYLQAGGSVGNAGTIDGGINGVVIQGGAGTVVNSGAIAATDSNTGAGIALENGGYVGNSAGGTVSGFNNGVFIQGSAGTVDNLGTVASTGSNGSAVAIGPAGGLVINGTAGSTLGLISGYHLGIGFFPGAAAALTVVNYGRIESTQLGTAAGTGFNGFAINAGTSSTTVVDNFGTVAGSQTVGGGAILIAGGQITNEAGGLIDGAGGNAITVLKNGGNAVDVTNFGTIANAPGSTNATIYIDHGGIVTNDVGALIINTTRVAISFANNNGSSVSVGSVVNAGTIVSRGTTNANGVYFGQGGTVINQAGGLIASYNAAAVSLKNTAGVVANSGTIAQTGTGTNGTAIYLNAGGTVLNYGLISEARAGIPGTISPAGYPGAVDTHSQPATVLNFGTITALANNNGVDLLNGGVLINGTTNDTTALIAAPRTAIYAGGTFGVATPGAIATVVNYGTIDSTQNDGVILQAGGTVINHGMIASGIASVSFRDFGGTLDNFGAIVSIAPLSGTTGAGVALHVGGGTITNEAGASIAAYRSAVSIAGTDTTNAAALVTNLGTLIGNKGVSIGAGDTGNNTIVNYGTITGTSGTAIALGSGNDAVILEPGSQLAGAIGNFHQGDTIDLPGVSANGISYASGVVTLTSGTTVVAQLDVSTPLGNPLFTQAPDGSGGSDITVTGAIVVSAGVTFVVSAGETLSNIIVLSGGILDVDAGATVIDVQIGAGGVENVAAGGLDVSATVASGGFQDLFGTASGTLIVTGGSQTVELGGVADNTVLDSAAVQTVSGTASGTVVSSGDTQIVASGGVASDTTVSSGGTQIVSSGGSASGSVVYNGGTEIVSAGGLDVGAVLSGGLEEVFGTASGALIASGGRQIVETGGSESGTVIGGGGTLELGVGATENSAIVLSGAGGVLQVDDTTMPGVAIGGFVRGDAIDLGALPFSPANTVSFDPTFGVLTVSGGSQSDTLTLTGVVLSGAAFALLADGRGGTVVREVPPAPTGLTLASDTGVLGDNRTDVPNPLITGSGFAAGDTVTLFDGGFAVGSGTVNGGAWSVSTNVLANGSHSLTAIESDPFGDVGAASAPLVITIDTTPPTTQQSVLAVGQNSAATPIGIAGPSDPDDAAAALTITVDGLPSNGTVLLSDGVTVVTAGEQLTIAQLTGLEFIPTANASGQSSTFTYTVSDAAGNTAFGAAFLGIDAPAPPGGPALVNGLGGPEGFGENMLPPNDDGSSGPIDITSVFGPGGINFFGHNYTSLYINNNGNITFNAPLSSFTPGPITAGAGNPIIAPFWADVDTRGGPGIPTGGNASGSNAVWYDLDTVDHIFTVTWDDVGYFSGHTNELDAFQLQLIDEGGGNFDIVFRYQAINWTTGDASGGSGGLGGIVARAGFSAGNGVNAFELPQSGNQAGMLGLPSNPAPAGTEGATTQPGVYEFQVRSGVVVPPPPTGLALSPASDTGVVGDDVTEVTTPIITGNGVSGDTVTLFDGGSQIGGGTIAGDGTWAIQVSAPLALGIHNLTATEADSLGDVSSPSTALSLSIISPATLFDFVFTYGDGKDYYAGTVADDGSFGYFVGDTFSFGLGQYQILNNLGSTSAASGTVVVTDYSHDGPGLASVTPVDTAAGLPDGAHGLGSESDAVLETDGQTQFFSPTVEVPFPTTALFGFVYTYANGAFYTGTVADDGRFGLAAGSRTITDGAGNLLGTYTLFAEGTTARAAGTVVIDRVTVDGQSFIPNQTAAGGIDGSGGLGSEAGSITVNGQTVAFSDLVAPAVVVTIQTAPLTPPPNTGDVIAAEVNQIFADVLGRNPTPNELSAYSTMLAAGTSPTSVRQILAQSSEGQSDLNQLYVQIFNQGIDPTDDATYTNQIIEGSSLAAVQLLLAQSPQAQADLDQIFQEVLARPIDGFSLITYMGALASGGSLATVRNTLAFSPQAQSDLNLLFSTATGRSPSAAELAGMEDQLANGSSQAGLQSALTNTGSAGGYLIAPVPAGSAGLTAAPGTPTLFAFGGASFGNDTISGFDPNIDTIQLPQTFAANFAGLQTLFSADAGGTLITLGAGQSILVEGVAPGSLSAANFLLGPAPASPPITAVPQALPADDFAGTGSSDILWRNSDGSLALWTMNGPAMTAAQALTYQGGVASPDSSWSVAGTGDFNGDGMADILWRDANGALSIWTMVGSQIAAESTVVAPDASWSIAGIGDFNGDRMADILWQNDNGTVAIWEMNGTSIVNLASDAVSGVDPSWHIRGTGDFNGDGTSDILWQNDNGTVAVWEMNGTNILNLAGDAVSGVDPSWHIRGTGDFNGDGKSDILWQNDNGAVAIWEMNGTSILNLASDAVSGVDPSWHILGTGDFNGDGKSDILWQNDNGAVAIWEMNGTSILNLASDGAGGADPSWHIIPPDSTGEIAPAASPSASAASFGFADISGTAAPAAAPGAALPQSAGGGALLPAAAPPNNDPAPAHSVFPL